MESNRQLDRKNLLADIAELYFVEGKNQSEIAQVYGMTRSNVSRLLTEARNSGIITFQINRPIRENLLLAHEITQRFGLKHARIVEVDQASQLLIKLGKTAGTELMDWMKPGWILGTSWGTAISSTTEQLEPTHSVSGVKVVQLLGALGARIKDYDGHAIVRRLEEKLEAEGIYINAPFVVENQEVAQSLIANKSVNESIRVARKSDIALFGVGSTATAHCSYYLADYINYDELLSIQETGAIGDVCGRFYDINGNFCAQEFQKRLIGVPIEDLMGIPIRIGVAGGPSKVEPIIGALRNGVINVLVSDNITISQVLNTLNTL